MTEFRIVSQRLIAKDTYELRLAGDTRAMHTPGQFLALRLPGFFLRRPMSVSDWDAEGLRLFYKVVGKGTAALSKNTEKTLDALVGLGNGFTLSDSEGKTPVLIGGGVGVPPLFGLAKALVAQKKTPVVLLGFNTKDEIFLAEDFRALGCRVDLFTMDGSTGTQGTVLPGVEALCKTHRPEGLYIYSCGPMPMFRALFATMQEKGMDGAFSLEERMGCAVGVCMGCTVKTTNGPRRVCKEGPVFRKEELPWA